MVPAPVQVHPDETWTPNVKGGGNPAKRGDFRRQNDFSLHRIEVDVIHQAGERSCILHQQGLVTSLKQMPAFVPQSIEARANFA